MAAYSFIYTLSLISIVGPSFLNSRALVAKSPRPYRMSKQFINPQLWCAPHCATYIKVTYISVIPGQSWGLVQYLMGDAEADAQKQLRALGDVNISGGLYVYRAYGLDMFIRDSNNHQMTWGVLREALRALTDYFEEIQRSPVLPGSILFTVYDGKNEVGTGAFGAVQGSR